MEKRKFFGRKAATAVSAAVIVALSAGLVYAYWGSQGAGSGSVPVADGTSVPSATVTDNSVTLAAMFPGQAAQPVTVTVKNPATNDASMYIQKVNGYVTVAGGSGACTSADIKLGANNGSLVAGSSATNLVPLTWTAQELQAAALATATGSVQFFDSATVDQSGCQGATVTLHYVVS